MNATNTFSRSAQSFSAHCGILTSEILNGADVSIGGGFTAESFRAREIGETMDPLVMVDHYVMTEPTFGAHPHAGMSAVSLLFEDSEGLFHNRDSLGNDFDLRPGDLYWLNAGSGAVHDESPRANARIHGLQVFVNLPQTQRFENPTSRLVRSGDMPIINGTDYRVKVALGESNSVQGATTPVTPMTILDGTIEPGGRFTHETATSRGIWVQAIMGSIDVDVGKNARQLILGQAIAMKANSNAKVLISNPSRESVQFVLFDGARIAETYVHEGTFVMDSQHQIDRIKAVYEAGELGAIANNR